MQDPSVYPTLRPYEKVSSCDPGGVTLGPLGGASSGNRATMLWPCAAFVTMAHVCVAGEDACVQDEAAWGGNPIGGLIPAGCVLN